MSCTRALVWLAGVIVLSIVLHTSPGLFQGMHQGYDVLLAAGQADASAAASRTVCPMAAFVALVILITAILLYTYSAASTTIASGSQRVSGKTANASRPHLRS